MRTSIQGRRNLVPENAKLLSTLAFLTSTLAALARLGPLALFGHFAGEGATSDSASVSGLSLSTRSSADGRFLDMTAWGTVATEAGFGE